MLVQNYGFGWLDGRLGGPGPAGSATPDVYYTSTATLAQILNKKKMT